MRTIIRWFWVILLTAQVAFSYSPVFCKTNLDPVEHLLQQMTLAEKIGQMTQVDRSFLRDDQDIIRYGLGSLLSGGNSTPTGTTPLQMRQMIRRYQSQALKTRLKVPLIYGVDAVHGLNNLEGTVIFPHNIGMGATRDPQLVERAARITATEASAAGIHWTFAPCVAVTKDVRWGRTYESYGETPELVTQMGTAAIKGLQGSWENSPTMLACAKHFIGDGGTRYGTGRHDLLDQGDLQMNEAKLRRLFLPPYRAAINAGVLSIMASFSSWNGDKVHGSHYLLTKLLKEELRFDGLVVSDWEGIQQLPGDFATQVKTAINAGIDMVMVPQDYIGFIQTAKALVASGDIPLARIDDAVRRILMVKHKLGLFEHPYAASNTLKSIGSYPHRQVARECVRKSLVLLKNHSNILPLDKNQRRILVAGKSADDIGNQCGGWTITWQGQSGAITSGTTVLQAIRAAVSAKTVVDYAMNGHSSEPADVAIVVVGETPYAEFSGDSANLGLNRLDRQVIQRIKKRKIPIILILISGRPLTFGEELADCAAIIAAWLPGTEGQGITDVLFGDHPPTGKLPFSWPRNIPGLPVNIGDPGYQALFNYGFGLTY